MAPCCPSCRSTRSLRPPTASTRRTAARACSPATRASAAARPTCAATAAGHARGRAAAPVSQAEPRGPALVSGAVEGGQITRSPGPVRRVLALHDLMTAHAQCTRGRAILCPHRWGKGYPLHPGAGGIANHPPQWRPAPVPKRGYAPDRNKNAPSATMLVCAGERAAAAVAGQCPWPTLGPAAALSGRRRAPVSSLGLAPLPAAVASLSS